MSLYQRGKVWHYDFAVAGQRYRGSTKEIVLSRAKRTEVLLIAEAQERGPSILPRRTPILREFAKRFLDWVDESQLEPESKKYYRSGWNMIQATPIVQVGLNRITTDEVAALHFPGSPQNGNRALRTLRRILGKAAEWGVIRAAPRIKLLKEQGRMLLIDQDTETRLLAVASQPLQDVLIIMLDTGLRPSEVFRMLWEHIDWEYQTIFNPCGKSPKARRFVPMSKRVCEVLRARSNGAREGWVFSSSSKTGHLATVAKAFAAARKRANINQKVVLYCARHTFATHTLAETGNLAAVMAVMGHSSPQVAMVYQHPGLEAIREAIDARNRAATERHNSRHSGDLVQ